MDSKFKVGDKVRCIDPTNGLEKDAIYTVDKHIPNYYSASYRGTNNAITLVEFEWAGEVYASRFELVEESILAPDKYKTGDIVQHKKGNFYKIDTTPSQGLIIEETGEPAYLYYPFPKNGKAFVRSKDKMEDESRFWKVEGVKFNNE